MFLRPGVTPPRSGPAQGYVYVCFIKTNSNNPCDNPWMFKAAARMFTGKSRLSAEHIAKRAHKMAQMYAAIDELDGQIEVAPTSMKRLDNLKRKREEAAKEAVA